MIAKRLAAVALAVALIAGAWIVRSEVIADDGDASADTPATADVLLCVTELADICRQVGGEVDLSVAELQAGETVDKFAATGSDPALWLTFDGFPQMVNAARIATGAEPFAYTATALASSPIAAIGEVGRLAPLVAACGDPVDLGCLGAQNDLKRSVSSIGSGIGLLSVSAAIASRTDVFSPNDTDLALWARSFQRATASIALSGGTAVETLQTRPTADVALGAEAEIVRSRIAEFDVLYAEPMVRATVVLVRPSGLDEPDGLATSLTDALREVGWEEPIPTAPDALPPPDQMLAIRSYWENL